MLTLTSPEALRALTGQDSGRSSWHEVTQERIQLAEATEDWKRIHIEPVHAENGRRFQIGQTFEIEVDAGSAGVADSVIPYFDHQEAS